MSFSFHSDVVDHPAFSRLDHAAFGLWVRARCWTSANQSWGFVPDHAVVELAGAASASGAVAQLVDAGLWIPQEGEGYRMAYGPGSDFPLPLWRYDRGSPKNGLFEILHDGD